ncbi:MAG: hypothetical protein VKN13_03590 [Cyanobacteriota bacterium]|nr:hypothetical protein [Cyanobacteriota bacterium]
MDLTALQQQASRGPLTSRSEDSRPGAPTASERVLAAELQDRDGEQDALSLMVSSIARMVQNGRASASRWRAS